MNDHPPSRPPQPEPGQTPIPAGSSGTRPLRLSVATNFDDALLSSLASHGVEEVYGKLTRDFVGGGRASYSTGDVQEAGLASHLKEAHRLGIRFNYLLNAVCLGNREWSREGYREIRKLLDSLSRLGVDAITVSLPFLGSLIKRHYPHFQLKAGIFANIDSPARARFWADLGADTLVLESYSINRNFPVLRAIREAVTCDLQLIANFTCLPQCPMQIHHMVGISHGSNTSDTTPFLDYCVFQCSSMTLRNPGLLIRSQWIRPEDLDRYEQIGSFSFKILERNAPTETLVQRVKAYATRTSPDNLLDLLQPFGFKKEIRKEFAWFFRVLLARPRLLFPLYKLLKLRGMLYPLKGNPLFLDSRKIPADFLAEVSRRPCSVSHDCRRCEYCDAIAAAAYRVEPEYRKTCLDLYEKVFAALC